MAYSTEQLTKIINTVVPDRFANTISEISTRDSVLLSSSILFKSAELDAHRSQASGTLVQIPAWKPLEAEMVPMKEGEEIPVSKIEATVLKAIRHFRAFSFGATDLSRILGSADPIAEMVAQCARIGAVNDENMFQATLEGVFNSPDMQSRILDVSAQKPAGKTTASDENLMSSKLILRALRLLGDRHANLTTLVMHSAVVSQLRERNLISTIPQARGEIDFKTYLGKRIIETDQCPVIASEDGTAKFTSYLLADSLIGYSSGYCPNLVPVAMVRNEAKSETVLYNRRCTVFHPTGFSWEGSTDSPSPFNTDLSNGANWKRVFELRNIPMVKLITNG